MPTPLGKVKRERERGHDLRRDHDGDERNASRQWECESGDDFLGDDGMKESESVYGGCRDSRTFLRRIKGSCDCVRLCKYDAE